METDREHTTLSLHGNALQWTNDTDSGAFSLPEREAHEEKHERCPRCGSPTLEQIKAWLVEELRTELFHSDGSARLMM